MLLRFVLTFMFAHGVEAKTVVLRATKADVQDYQAFVLSSPAYESASTAQLSRFPTPEDREMLASAFAKAQASFMQGSMIQAQEDFRAIISLVETDQWKEDEQSVFLLSYFRLAQLAHRPEETEDWLKQAVIWAPNGALDEKFFPPPLVEKFKQIKNSLPKLKVDFSAFAGDFNFLLLNGRTIPLAESLSETLPEGPLRATFISDTFQTITIETTTDLISNAAIERKPWVDGSCQKFQMHWQHSGSVAKPYFSRNCAPVKKPSPEVDVAYHPSAPEPIPIPVTTVSTTSSAPFYERTWFWIGMGAVATAVVVASLSSHESQPTTHEGF
jgi:hypothetical protein